MTNGWSLRQYFYQKRYQTFKFSGEIWPGNSLILDSGLALFTTVVGSHFTNLILPTELAHFSP